MNNVLECLEKTAAKRSYHTAVDDGSICLTWTELLELSQKTGTAFCRRTKPGKPIVLLIEKGAVTLAAMFGVVYAGCFYVMVDPGQPPERIREIIKVLSPGLVVANKESNPILEQMEYCGNTCLLRDVIQEKINVSELNSIRKKSRDTDILYGIFTSGSTGTPKGIVVNHRAVIDFITHFTQIFGFTEKDRLGNQAPFDFDVSVKDIYTCIMTGAELVLIPKKLFSTPSLLLDYVCKKKVNTLIWAVSALTLVSALKGLKYRVPTDVKRVLFSGEVMPTKQLRLWQAALPKAEFVNLYGPSEITCNCTYYPVRRLFMDDEKLPLGRTFPGRKVFLLDKYGKEITIAGGVGEICVAGESLSEGYYHNETETKARFKEDFADNTVGRYYCTGDLGYYDRDGELYFSGRKDFQIKHMGHRIELEEIEHALNQAVGIEKSCCLMNEKKNQLVAFYFGEAEEKEIREQMKRKVPSYMIPHKMIRVENMPLNKNGKTDRAYFRNWLEVTV